MAKKFAPSIPLEDPEHAFLWIRAIAELLSCYAPEEANPDCIRDIGWLLDSLAEAGQAAARHEELRDERAR